MTSNNYVKSTNLPKYNYVKNEYRYIWIW